MTYHFDDKFWSSTRHMYYLNHDTDNYTFFLINCKKRIFYYYPEFVKYKLYNREEK